MRKIYLLLILLITSAVSFGQNLAVNGGFENWTGGVLDTWTSESGTTITQETTTFSEGTYAANFEVTTTTQGDTDFRQSIDVTAGTVYNVSVDIYQVDNGSRARIYAGNYQGYSDPALVGEWQTITYEYTAAGNESIEFGLRFYDTDDWNGTSSFIIVDNFIVEAQSGPSLAILSPSDGESVVGPDVDVELSVQNFEVGATDAGLDGHIHYSLDAGGTVMVYDTDPIALTGLADGEHTVDVWLVDNTHTPLDPPVEASVTFTVTSITEVADLAALRASAEGGIYEVTGEVIVTFVTGNNRNQIFIQDATAGMLIDDNAGTITTAYMDGDGITGLTGQLGSYADMLQFVPTEDPGAATSSANSISPQMVTLTDLENNLDMYESELVMINGVTFADGDGTTTFTSNTNYDISDSTSSAFVFRTNYPNDNLEGELIPNTPVNIMTLAGEFFGTPQVYPTGADYLLSVNEINSLSTLSMYPNPVLGNQVTIQTQGNGTISVSVFDVLGKNVLNKEISNNTLNVSSLKSGIYLVRISQNGFNTTKKLVVK
ncbi:T9SS type A sorting domain-containing protein [Mangrovimonas sp. CR14]|uniref:T9SS type A sorting domain-containing protein n=1 Tax=Mangrovimonas sp. CR14 TaxID=2706120 RepID=UPI00141F609A|nr:T9SS type A sorting domain-containing protein [Mangrovimonas sp. CR14]NIK91626.1 T9SS type A sorting domain-containing protein [Mangrovimonas sp. CR14]